MNATRIALITGGCGDLGFASAIKMAEMGMDIVLLDRIDTAQAEKRLQLLRSGGTEVLYVKADVTDRGAVENAVHQLWDEKKRLDVCMCNAGITLDVPLLNLTVEQWHKHIDVNLTGYFHVLQTVARRWVESGHRGKFIFTGSWVQDIPYKLIAAYCVSKAGVWMLARCAALELAPHGITVNVVAPGIVDGGLSAQEMIDHPEMREEFMRIIPLGRLQSPQDVADVVGFLASPASDYLTGSSIICDGGCVVGSASVVGR